MLTSDFRPEVEIRQFGACALKNIQYNPYLWSNRRNFRVIMDSAIWQIRISTECIFYNSNIVLYRRSADSEIIVFGASLSSRVGAQSCRVFPAVMPSSLHCQSLVIDHSHQQHGTVVDLLPTTRSCFRLLVSLFLELVDTLCRYGARKIIERDRQTDRQTDGTAAV